VDLGFCLDLEGLRLTLFRAEDFDEIFEMPGLDVVVCCVHAVDESLDREAVVADYETVDISGDREYLGANLHYGFQSKANDRAELLGSKLK
jgi:hypothetical protein